MDSDRVAVAVCFVAALTTQVLSSNGQEVITTIRCIFDVVAGYVDIYNLVLKINIISLKTNIRLGEIEITQKYTQHI